MIIDISIAKMIEQCILRLQGGEGTLLPRCVIPSIAFTFPLLCSLLSDLSAILLPEHCLSSSSIRSSSVVLFTESSVAPLLRLWRQY